MKPCSAIDTNDMLYKVLRRGIDDGRIAISGILCHQDDRPDDSATEDIVINTIAITRQKPQTATSNVNIYVPDKRVKIRGKEQTKADWARIAAIGDAVADVLEAVNPDELEIWIESDIVVQEPSAAQHCRNIRVRWNIH